jgi:hypothetical protein
VRLFLHFLDLLTIPQTPNWIWGAEGSSHPSTLEIADQHATPLQVFPQNGHLPVDDHWRHQIGRRHEVPKASRVLRALCWRGGGGGGRGDLRECEFVFSIGRD